VKPNVCVCSGVHGAIRAAFMRWRKKPIPDATKWTELENIRRTTNAPEGKAACVYIEKYAAADEENPTIRQNMPAETETRSENTYKKTDTS
jgi:hypothetical protein